MRTHAMDEEEEFGARVKTQKPKEGKEAKRARSQAEWADPDDEDEAEVAFAEAAPDAELPLFLQGGLRTKQVAAAGAELCFAPHAHHTPASSRCGSDPPSPPSCRRASSRSVGCCLFWAGKGRCCRSQRTCSGAEHGAGLHARCSHQGHARQHCGPGAPVARTRLHT